MVIFHSYVIVYQRVKQTLLTLLRVVSQKNQQVVCQAAHLRNFLVSCPSLRGWGTWGLAHIQFHGPSDSRRKYPGSFGTIRLVVNWLFTWGLPLYLSRSYHCDHGLHISDISGLALNLAKEPCRHGSLSTWRSGIWCPQLRESADRPTLTRPATWAIRGQASVWVRPMALRKFRHCSICEAMVRMSPELTDWQAHFIAACCIVPQGQGGGRQRFWYLKLAKIIVIRSMSGRYLGQSSSDKMIPKNPALTKQDFPSNQAGESRSINPRSSVSPEWPAAGSPALCHR